MANTDPLIGKEIGTYKILGRIGKGGMGVVYKALDQSLQRPAALKFIPDHLVENPDIIKRFAREARASARLNHPNIVTIYGMGKHEDLYFIAMEFVEGTTLDGLVRKEGRLEMRRAVEIIRQAADALEEAHKHDIIHRDIKPQNIMIDLSGRVRVMDFGLAIAGFENTQLTAEGRTLGTPQYMPPEQWADSKVDGRSDIYSLGVALYEMLSGGPLFSGSNALAIMRKIVDGPSPVLAENHPDVSQELSDIVGKMIAKSADDRYSSAGELSAALQSYLGWDSAPKAVVDQFSSPAAAKELDRMERESNIQERSLAMSAASAPAVQQAPPAQAPGPDEPPPSAPTGQEGVAGPSGAPRFLWAGIAVAAIAVLGIVLWFTLGGNRGFSDTFPKSGFVYIGPGAFYMGSPPAEAGRQEDETFHAVTITRPFYLAKQEVTQAQWEDVMGSNPSGFPGGNRPVETVSWVDVQRFIETLNARDGTEFRLPTEAEWEYACRAGNQGVYAYGDRIDGLDAYAWYERNSEAATHPVGLLSPNDWGLYDMHGNVWEWCEDWAGAYGQGDATDPRGPEEGTLRIGRGGSFINDAVGCRSADRSAKKETDEGAVFGFRLCK